MKYIILVRFLIARKHSDYIKSIYFESIKSIAVKPNRQLYWQVRTVYHPMVLKFGAIMIVLLLGSIKLYLSYVDNWHISNIVIPSDDFCVLIKMVFEIDSTYVLFSQISFKVLVYFSWYIVSFFPLFCSKNIVLMNTCTW